MIIYCCADKIEGFADPSIQEIIFKDKYLNDINRD